MQSFNGVYECAAYRSGDKDETIRKEVLQLNSVEAMPRIIHQQSFWTVREMQRTRIHSTS